MLRVMSLNVGSLFEPEWDERRHEVVAQILAAAPDVVTLQELWRNGITDHPQWIVDALRGAGADYFLVFGGHGVDGWMRQDPSFRWGSAIMSRWPIEDSNLWSLPTVEDDDPIPASMPWELVHARTADLDIFTTHLAPAPTHGRHRRLQVQEIVGHIKDVRGDLDDHPEDRSRRSTMPPILTGDFNAEPESDEIRFLKGLTVLEDMTAFMQDAWAVAGSGGAGFTNDWVTHPLAEMLNVHRKRIDYIFVGDPFRRLGDGGRVLDCRIVANEPITSVQASDHCGLVADIVWPQRPR